MSTQSEQLLATAAAFYKAETGYTPREHFHRTSAILTTREERNEARARFNEIVEALELAQSNATEGLL